MKLTKFIASVLSMAVSGAAFAGSSYIGRVKVHCNADAGHCYLNILATAQNIPACAGNPQ
jgi:hypothetical protein